MHQQSETETELMDWFDKQRTDTKLRISAYVINTGKPMAEILRFLKTLEERDSRDHLVHPGGKQWH
jgi:hypothetical protein